MRHDLKDAVPSNRLILAAMNSWTYTGLLITREVGQVNELILLCHAELILWNSLSSELPVCVIHVFYRILVI